MLTWLVTSRHHLHIPSLHHCTGALPMPISQTSLMVTMLRPLWPPQLGRGQLGLLPLYIIPSLHNYRATFDSNISDEFDGDHAQTSVTSTTRSRSTWLATTLHYLYIIPSLHNYRATSDGNISDEFDGDHAQTSMTSTTRSRSTWPVTTLYYLPINHNIAS